MKEEIYNLIDQLSKSVESYHPTPEFYFYYPEDTPRGIFEKSNSTTTSDIHIRKSQNGVVKLQDSNKIIDLIDRIGKKTEIKFTYRMETNKIKSSYGVQQFLHYIRIGYVEDIFVKSLGYTETIDDIEKKLKSMCIDVTKEFDYIKDDSIRSSEFGKYQYWSWLVVPCFVTLTGKLPSNFESEFGGIKM
jgi:hypothetical protein